MVTQDSITVVSQCEGGMYYNTKAHSCSECPMNTYCSLGKDTACTPCPNGGVVMAGKGKCADDCSIHKPAPPTGKGTFVDFISKVLRSANLAYS